MPNIFIVVPCYNEAARLSTSEFERFIDDHPEIGFCFVDDGSRDDTARVLHSIADNRADRVEVIEQPVNRGKAEAVRTGIVHVLDLPEVRYVGFWDADLATPLDEILRFVDVAMSRPEIRLIYGSRIRRMGADIKRKICRHYLGRLFATAASLTLGIAVYDTQCGAKLIESQLARTVFCDPFTSSWLFDVEILARTINVLGRDETLGTTIEIPLTSWKDQVGSNLKLRHFMRAPFDLAQIWLRYRHRR